jgi:hypothetical protein
MTLPPVLHIEDRRLAHWLVSAPIEPVRSHEPIYVASARCIQVKVPGHILPLFWPLVEGCAHRQWPAQSQGLKRVV